MVNNSKKNFCNFCFDFSTNLKLYPYYLYGKEIITRKKKFTFFQSYCEKFPRSIFITFVSYSDNITLKLLRRYTNRASFGFSFLGLKNDNGNEKSGERIILPKFEQSIKKICRNWFLPNVKHAEFSKLKNPNDETGNQRFKRSHEK